MGYLLPAVQLTPENFKVSRLLKEIDDGLTPQATALLDEICSGRVIASADLPTPTRQERRAPRTA